MIEDQYFYRNYSKYFSLIEYFLNRIINVEVFVSNLENIKIPDNRRLSKLTFLYDKCRRPFDTIQQQNDLKKLFASSIDYESNGFYYLISQMDEICDELDPYSDEGEFFDEDELDEMKKMDDLGDENIEDYLEEIQEDFENY